MFHETDLHEERKEGTGRLGRKEGEKEGGTAPLGGTDAQLSVAGWLSVRMAHITDRLTVTQEGGQVTNYK